VVTDMLFALDKTFPHRPEFRHAEGNTTFLLGHFGHEFADLN
jgi:hypothetical protein